MTEQTENNVLKSKAKVILIATAAAGLFIWYLVWQVMSLTDSWQEETPMTTQKISFGIKPNDSKPTVGNDNNLSSKEQLLARQKQYKAGLTDLEGKNKSKGSQTSFSSLFTTKDPEVALSSNGSTPDKNMLVSAALAEAYGFPTGSDIKPDLTGNSTKKSNAADEAYADLEADIQSFFPNHASADQKKESATPQPLPVETELERKKRIRQNGYNVGSDPGEQITESSEIHVAIRGTQELSSGQSVKLRVLNNTYYNGIEIPKNTILDGKISIASTGRVNIAVSALAVNRVSHKVDLRGYDMYGQLGLPLTQNKGLNVGADQVADAGLQVAKSAAGGSIIGRAISGSLGSIKKEDSKTIKVIDGQKLTLKK